MPHRRTHFCIGVIPRLGAVLCAGALIGGCSQDNTSQSNPRGGFTLAVDPVSPQIEAGKSVDMNISITRSGGFSGSVNFALSGQPAGVTATYSAVQSSGPGMTATATIVVDTSVAPGPYNFRLGASGGGASANADVGLTVVRAPPDFTVVLSPNPISILQGGTWTVQVTIATTSFQNEFVHLDLLNAPPGVSGTFQPDSLPGGSSTLTLAVDSAVVAGTYEMTVRGSGAALPTRSVPLALSVTPALGGLAVSLDFTECAGSERPTSLAMQDGSNGAWLPLAGAAGVYQASFTQSKVGIAYTLEGMQPGLLVSYLTRAEVVAAQPYRFCRQLLSRTVNGTAAGLAAGESAYIGVGNGVTVAAANGAFQLQPILTGPHDLVGYKSSSAGVGVADRFFLLRDQDPGLTVGTVDFGGTDAFTPVGVPMQVAGSSPGASTSQTMAFLTGSGCDFSLLYGASPISGPGFTAYGPPADLLRPTDFHQLVVTTTDPGNTSIRTVAESFQRMAPRTLRLGGMLPAVSIGNLPGAYKRLQADGSPPPDYQSNAFFFYSAVVGAKTHVASIVASSGWLEGPDVMLVMPDLSGVPGFDGTAPPPVTSTGSWSFTVSGMSGGSLCSEGSRTATATRTGTF